MALYKFNYSNAKAVNVILKKTYKSAYFKIKSMQLGTEHFSKSLLKVQLNGLHRYALT